MFYISLLLFFAGCSNKQLPLKSEAKPTVLVKFRNVHQATLEQVMADAQAQNKVVFLDFYTTWCGPCKWMDENVFAKEDVGRTFNKNFINYKVDAEDFEGVNTALKYNVNAYPTLVFVKPNGDVLHRVEGMIPHESFMQIAEEVLVMK